MRKSFAAFMVSGMLAFPLQAGAETVDLSSAWEQAREYDAQLRISEAENTMQQEEVAKARAGFLPSLQAQSSFGRNRTVSTSLVDPDNIEGRRYYNTESSSLTLKQQLFNLGTYASYKQAKAVAAKSDAALQNETTGLMVRVVEAYFNVLFAEGNRTLAEAKQQAAEARFQQAEKALQHGLGTVTERDKARADHDMAKAELLVSQNSLDFNRREFERLTGTYPDEIADLAYNRFEPEAPVPSDIGEWIAMAREKSPDIGMALQELEITRREVHKNQAAGYPTLDLVAGRSYSQSETNYTIDQVYETWSVSLQAKVPIYTGGYVSASVRQAKAGRIKATEEFSWYERQVVSDVRKYYNATINAMAQVDAFRLAVASRQTALRSMQKGVESGMATNVDVLNARYELATAHQDLTRATFQYLLNSIMLKDTAGTLAEQDIHHLNTLLGQ